MTAPMQKYVYVLVDKKKNRPIVNAALLPIYWNLGVAKNHQKHFYPKSEIKKIPMIDLMKLFV